MRVYFLTFFFLFAGFLRGADPSPIPVEKDILGRSIADRVQYLKDPEHRLTIDSIIQKDLSERFRNFASKRGNLGFTDATIWVKGSLVNRTVDEREFLLEASRALTNVVILYKIEDGKVSDTIRAGDHQPFRKRAVPSRKNVFPITLEPGEKLRFALKLRSHGETLVIPITIWDHARFFDHERREQWYDGFFYGIFFFVFLIFAFFYGVLRDPSFLYYILYILSFGTLQFSLDGYSYRVFFSDTPWMADKIMVFSSSLTIFMLLLYASTYLKVKARSPKLYRVFQGLMGGALFFFFLAFFPTSISKYCNPSLNIFSLLSVIFVLGSILFLKARHYSVSNIFMTAYILLISGAVVFILGNSGVIESNAFTLNGLKYGGLGEVIFLSFTMAEKYREIQREKELAQKESLEQVEALNRIKDEYNKELEQEVEQRTQDLEREREKLDVINREMLSSIRYAERIQRAILPADQKFDQLFRDHFVLFKPRDIVSGDIYWCSADDEGAEDTEAPPSEGLTFSGLSKDPVPSDAKKQLFSVMDCTGHGVPGAFLTFLGQSILTRAKKEASVKSPAQALSFIDRELRATLSEIQAETQVQDGMDMGLCALDSESLELHFAGAGHDCYIVRNGEAHVMKGDRIGIGGEEEGEKRFTDQRFQLQKGDQVYLFSDGFPDQFGGPNNKKFKYRPFRDLLVSLSEEGMADQKEELEKTFQEWKGDLEQVDDVCVMGIRV